MSIFKKVVQALSPRPQSQQPSETGERERQKLDRIPPDAGYSADQVVEDDADTGEDQTPATAESQRETAAPPAVARREEEETEARGAAVAAEFGSSSDDSSGEDESLVVHPAGLLEVRQTVAPLGTSLEKFGNASPAEYDRFDIAGLTPVDAPLASEPNIEAGTPPPQHDVGLPVEAAIGVSLGNDDSDDDSSLPRDDLASLQPVQRVTPEIGPVPNLLESGLDSARQIADIDPSRFATAHGTDLNSSDLPSADERETPAEAVVEEGAAVTDLPSDRPTTLAGEIGHGSIHEEIESDAAIEWSDLPSRDGLEPDSGIPDLLKGEGLGVLDAEPSLRTPGGSAGQPPPPVTTEAMETEADPTDGDEVAKGHIYTVAGSYEQDGEEYVLLRNPYGEPSGGPDEIAKEPPAPMTLEEAIATEIGPTAGYTGTDVDGTIPGTEDVYSAMDEPLLVGFETMELGELEPDDLGGLGLTPEQEAALRLIQDEIGAEGDGPVGG